MRRVLALGPAQLIGSFDTRPSTLMASGFGNT